MIVKHLIHHPPTHPSISLLCIKHGARHWRQTVYYYQQGSLTRSKISGLFFLWLYDNSWKNEWESCNQWHLSVSNINAALQLLALIWLSHVDTDSTDLQSQMRSSEPLFQSKQIISIDKILGPPTLLTVTQSITLGQWQWPLLPSKVSIHSASVYISLQLSATRHFIQMMINILSLLCSAVSEGIRMKGVGFR